MARRGVSDGASMLQRLWHGWKRFGRKLADVQSRVLLSVVYCTVIAPFALAIAWGADPLAVKPRTTKGWRARSSQGRTTLVRARQQF